MKKEEIDTTEKEESVSKEENVAAEETCNNEEVTKDDAAEESEEKEEKDPLAVAQAEIEELKKQMLYKQAEFENYRKRVIKEKAELILSGGEKTIKAILPVLDDFERALADKSDDPQAIRDGIQIIYNKFIKTLEEQGVKKIDTDGAEFTTDLHESVALVPGMGDDKKGKVIDCVQTGYTLNDKVIRYAKVAVGQ
jgi:molecular chaperone GrpE